MLISSGSYFSYYQRRKVNANPATNPVIDICDLPSRYASTIVSQMSQIVFKVHSTRWISSLPPISPYLYIPIYSISLHEGAPLPQSSSLILLWVIITWGWVKDNCFLSKLERNLCSKWLLWPLILDWIEHRLRGNTKTVPVLKRMATNSVLLNL